MVESLLHIVFLKEQIRFGNKQIDIISYWVEQKVLFLNTVVKNVIVYLIAIKYGVFLKKKKDKKILKFDRKQQWPYCLLICIFQDLVNQLRKKEIFICVSFVQTYGYH